MKVYEGIFPFVQKFNYKYLRIYIDITSHASSW